MGHDYEPDIWVKMIENTINKHTKYLSNITFWVETKTLTDSNGNEYDQMFPHFAANFK